MMVQTRAVTRKIESGQPLPQDTAVSPSVPKKRRAADRAQSPKKRHRSKPGELCQLNLDVLFLVYILPWLLLAIC